MGVVEDEAIAAILSKLVISPCRLLTTISHIPKSLDCDPHALVLIFKR